MSKHPQKTDLLGNPLKSRRPRYEAAIERLDKNECSSRAARVRWLNSVIPKNSGYAMPLESYLVFQEAKDSFVYGHYVATTLLALSFVEHWLGSITAERGVKEAQRKGLSAIVKCCRDNQLLPPMLCDKVDLVRRVRNPFVHLKSFDHPRTVTQRALRLRSSPFELLESDAKEALSAMYSVAVYAKAKI